MVAPIASAAARHYIDSSAYLAVILREPRAKEVEPHLQRAHLHSSVLLLLETNRNLVNLVRRRVMTAAVMQECLLRFEADLDFFELEDLHPDICSGLLMPALSTPRSLDLAHLRTAVWIHRRTPLARFVTLDRSQLAAARELGLPT